MPTAREPRNNNMAIVDPNNDLSFIILNVQDGKNTGKVDRSLQFALVQILGIEVHSEV